MEVKVGIICAGDTEFAAFIPHLKEAVVSPKAMLKFYSGKVEGIPVVTLFCGVCKTNAAIATQILLDTYGCTMIINAGTCGSMSDKIKLLDTVVSTEAGYWDVFEEILTEFHPWMESIYFKSDEGLLSLAHKAVEANGWSDVYFGRTVTGESFIDEQFRGEINEKFAPLCVDMETASIAHVCYVNKVPFVAVRTVTDTEESSGEAVFEENCEKCSQRSAEVVAAMLKLLKADGVSFR